MDRTTAHVIVTLSLSLLIMLANCKTSGAKKQISEGSIQKQIQLRLGDDVITEYNPSKSYALLRQLQDPKKIGTKSIHFMVIRLGDSVVVHEDSYLYGYVKWVDDSTLEKLSLPGKVKPDKDVSAYKKLIRIDQPTPKL